MTKRILASIISQSSYRRGAHEFCKSFIAGLILSFVTLSIIILPIIVGATKAFSATIYVPDDYSTIQVAVDAANPGDTIIVRDGTYTENVDVDKALTIQSENGPDLTTVQAADPNDYVFEATADYVNINGFTIIGEGKTAGGVSLSNANHCEIFNNNIVDGGYGIYLGSSTDNVITNNIISSHYYSGIQLASSSYNEVSNNNISSNGHGIRMRGYYSNDNLISNNTISSNGYGIHLEYSANNILSHNIVTLNTYFGIYISYSTNCTLIQNIISNNSRSSLLVHGSDISHYNHSIDTSNLVNGKPVYYFFDQENLVIDNYDTKCIIIAGCSNITVTNNNVSNGEQIYLAFTSNSVISNNVSSSNYVGISLYFSTNNTISNNTMNSNSIYGIYLDWNSSNNTLSNNTVNSNTRGIFVESSDNIISNNTVSSNYYYGIYLNSGSNLVKNNRLDSNGYGIYLRSSNNTIYLNNFIDNAHNVYSLSGSTNSWNSLEGMTYVYNDSAYTSYLGNYWDDYNGNDTNNDGIGDTPYTIDGDEDNYPLMQPFENYTPSENQGTITGKVTDSTGNPISGVTVSANGYPTFTASNGTYLLTIPVSTYSVTASASGFIDKTKDNITVTAGITTVNFSLTPKKVEKIIGKEGGTVHLGDGTKVTIPADALTSDTLIIIKALEPQSIPVFDPTIYLTPTDVARSFGPEGLVFAKPATITIPYTDEDIEGLDEDELTLYAWDGAQWRRVGGVVDTDANTITALVNHFRIFRIVEDTTPPGETFYVPDDYPTIQEAVWGVKSYSTIIVRKGTYVENIDVRKNGLVIKSENGAEVTIVQAADSNDHVFHVNGYEVTIQGFTIKGATGETPGFKAGVYLEINGNCLVSNNILSNNTNGIILSSANGNTVSQNTCSSNNKQGIVLVNSTSNVVSGNTVSSNVAEGILLIASNKNTLSNNAITSNGESGIDIIDSSSNNKIKNSTVSDNYTGIHLRSSSNNEIFLNSFTNNDTNAYSSESTNTWSSSEKMTYTYDGTRYANYLGNYWDDYTGNDANGDGVGDTPYSIDSDKDNYPLMQPFENYILSENQPPTASFTYSPENPVVGEKVTFDASSSNDPDGEIVSYEWDWDGDGSYNESTPNPIMTHSWSKEGVYRVGLKVTDNEGITDTFSEEITVEPCVEVIGIIHYELFGFSVLLKNNSSQNYILTFKVLDKDEDVSDAMYHMSTYPLSLKRTEDSFELPAGRVINVHIIFDPLKKEHLEDLSRFRFEFLDEDGNIIAKSEYQSAGEYDNITATSFDKSKDAYHFTPPEEANWCYGMSATSILYYLGKLTIPNGKPDTYSLTEDEKETIDMIKEYQNWWWLHYFFNIYIPYTNEWPRSKYEEFKQHLLNGEPLIILLGSWKKPNHAVVAYKIIEDTDNNMAYIMVYDNRYPYNPEQNPRFPEDAFHLCYIEYNLESGKLYYPKDTEYKSFKVVRAWKDPVRTVAEWLSPAEFRVYDSQNRVTGVINGQIQEQIPLSVCDEENETIAIFYPDDEYYYEVEGISVGTYGLKITSERKGEIVTFSATNISISSGAVHQYSIDWDALSQGGSGATAQMDNDGDGIFELTITTGETFTFIPATINIDPDTLNLNSEGKWITCYIELSEGYNVAKISLDSVTLECSSYTASIAENGPFEVGDYDGDGIPDLMVKFDRNNLITYLKNCGNLLDQVSLGIIGSIDDKVFGGSDTIKVIGDKKVKSMKKKQPSQSKFILYQNYPNPFNPETTIEYDINKDCHVTLKIYNMAGQLIKGR